MSRSSPATEASTRTARTSRERSSTSLQRCTVVGSRGEVVVDGDMHSFLLARTLITIFSIPKAFAGEIAVIQRNAVRSWRALGPDVQVILLGDEEGVSAAAHELGVEHVADVATQRPRNATARRRLRARRRDRSPPLRCFVNADIVLLDDFLPAVRAVAGRRGLGVPDRRRIGQSPRGSSPRARRSLRSAARSRARAARGGSFTRCDRHRLLRLSGRAVRPGAAVRRRSSGVRQLARLAARQRGAVVDASEAVLAVHQHHDYAHVGAVTTRRTSGRGRAEPVLAGGSRRLYTIHDASHRLTAQARAAQPRRVPPAARERPQDGLEADAAVASAA